MKPDLYQQLVTRVKKYSSNPSLYLLAKLTEETGEVAKEFVRLEDGKNAKKSLTSELGDVLWVVAAIAQENNIKLSEVMEENLSKLKKRNLL